MGCIERREVGGLHLTVKEALSIYPLSEAKLVAGAEGTSKWVKSINIMDAPDIADWIKTGELLFTTAYLLKESPDDVIAFIRKLKKRGCVGLGIKLGRFWRDIPQPVIDEADRTGFPLLVLPYQFTFSDQMNALFRAEHEKNTKRLQAVLRKQKQMMQYALKQADYRDMFSVLSNILDYPMAIVSAMGHIFYNSGNWPEELLADGMPWKPEATWMRIGSQPVYRIPLVHNGLCCGFFFVNPGDIRALKAEEGLLQQAAEMLSYHLGRNYQSYIGDTVQNELGLLMNQYLNGKIPVKTVLDQAERKNLTIVSGPYQCIWTTAPEPDEAGAAGYGMELIRYELHHHPELRKHQVHHFDLPDGILSIYTLPEGDCLGSGFTQSILDVFKNGVSDRASPMPMPQFFASRVKWSPDSLLEAYEECKEARKLAMRFRLNDRVVSFETIELAFLFQYVPAEAMKAYCDKLLHPLTNKGDEQYSRDMIRTLEVFVANNGIIHHTAKQLHIHRNTVIYRLDKIGELLKLDLKDYNDLTKLRLVFVFRSLLEKSAMD